MDHTPSPVIRFKRSWRSLIPQFLLASLCAVVGYYVTVNFPASSLEVHIPLGESEFVFRLPVFLLILLFLLARPIVMLFDSHFEISDHHLRIIRGHLSLRLRRQEFAFEDLLGVQTSQNIVERIFRVGSIRVGSKTPSIELFMRGVGTPRYYADLISRRIDASRIEQRAASGRFSG